MLCKLTLVLFFINILLLKNSFEFYTSINNVCKNFIDYYSNMDENKNCWFNPDVILSAPEIIRRHGYPFKKYSVTTEDGYILTVFRIPHGKHKNSTQKFPIFIQHGIGLSAIPFVDIGHSSLAFLLADEGYDVWLGNFRGSSYSDKHVSLNSNSKQYWNFTFHQNGIYDLPTQISLVTRKTRTKLIYIGYSMGTTSYFIYNSEFPEHAKMSVEASIALAPIAFMDHIRTPLRSLIPLWPLVKDFLYATTDGALNQRTPEAIKARFVNCLPYPAEMRACRTISYLLFGYDPAQENPETLPVIIIQDFDATCIKTLDHYIQLVGSGKFAQYDYGERRNLKVYGSNAPPDYNLTNVNVPVYLIRGDNDLLGTEKNVEKLFERLPAEAKPTGIFVVPLKTFSHADFITAKDVRSLLYDHVIKIVNTVSNVTKN